MTAGDPTDDSPGAASSKVHTRNVVNFAWDHDYYPGQVVSVSPVGGADFLAYGIVAPGKSEGVVRVVQRKTEQRTLLKGMRGKIKDLAFAHTKNKVNGNGIRYVRPIFSSNFLKKSVYLQSF